MAALTGEQVAQIAAQAGFSGRELIYMVGIAKRESRWDPAAKNPNTSDRGLFQINGANVKALTKAGIIRSQDDLFDPVKNAQAAYWLSGGGRNLKPWAADKKGWTSTGNPLYGVNIGEATTAVNGAQSQGLFSQSYAGSTPQNYGKAYGSMDPRFGAALNALIRASNGKLTIGESTRSEAQQKTLFLSRYVPDKNGSVSWNGQKWRKKPGVADAAPPGKSMHEVGLAADLKGDMNWLQQNASKFGLQTFAEVNNEPWHVQLLALPRSRSEYENSPQYIPYGSPSASTPAAAKAAGVPDSAGAFDATPYNYAGTPPAQQEGPRMIAQEERDQFNTYLKGKTPAEQQAIIEDLKKPRSLAEVGAFMSTAPPEVTRYVNFLGTLDASGQYGEKSMLAAPDPAGSTEMTNLLNTFGVSYPNAPNPTPALLAFLRGIGLNLSTAEDVKRRALERIGASTSDAMADIDRTAGRAKQNVTADLMRRGVLSSGESNTRYARQAEDVGNQRADVQRTSTQATEGVDDAYSNARDLARQQAMDRILGAEQQQATERATSAAQVDATRATQQAADDAWKRQQAAQEASTQAQEAALAKAGQGSGV